jgi:hypothetical protein
MCPIGWICIVIESDLTKEAQDWVVQEAARQSFLSAMTTLFHPHLLFLLLYSALHTSVIIVLCLWQVRV